MSSERNVPVVLDAKCRELASFVNRVGPANIRCLIDVGHFNYTTYKPHCNHLLELGIFKTDEKRRFRLTQDAGPWVVKGWAEKTLLERWESTHPDNLADLGIFEEVHKTLKTVYPRMPPAAEPLAPLPLDSKPVQDALECIRELDMKDPKQEVVGLSLLSWIALSQHPEFLRNEIAQREAAFLKEFNERSLWERISDWFWDSLPI